LKVREALRIGRAVRLVWSVNPRLTLASLGLMVLQGVVPLASVYMTKLIVDAVTAGITAADHAAAFRHVAWLIGIAALIGLVAVVARSAASIVDQALGQSVTDHVSDLIHAQSVAVDLEYYENPRYHDTLFRAQQEAPYRPMMIVNDLTSTGQALVSLVGMAALLLTLHWLVGVIVLLAAIPGAYVRFRYSGKLFDLHNRQTQAERQAWYAHWLLTDSEHAKELRLFGLGDRFRDRYRELRQQLRQEVIGLAGRRSLAELAAGAVAVIAVFGTFAFIAWRTITGYISLGLMVAYYQAFQTSLSSLQSVLSGLAKLYEDNLFLGYYEEFMALEPRVQAPAQPKPVPTPIVTGLRAEGLDFHYPGTERTALKGISLTIRPGEITAFVGPNGSGKTTLVKLLCRLYDPSAGDISLDGVDLREFDVVDLRKRMSVIFQDFAEYQLTARENIRLGNVSLAADDPAIEAAARDAGADAVIAGLPNGYDTVLGKWFEEGEELSVGEWQKIALARAFVRDAQILVFDEPTSALDPQAEWDVFQHIKELAGGPASGRAVILISHRFSTVRNADRIHIFDQGSIIESGTHEELMDLGGRYAAMYEVQARAYAGGGGGLVEAAAQPSPAVSDSPRSAPPSRPRPSGG
jgi:ATP-binding cassette, subfamily B, bacterial